MALSNDHFWVDKAVEEQPDATAFTYNMIAPVRTEEEKKTHRETKAEHVTKEFLKSLGEITTAFQDFKKKSNLTYKIITILNIAMFILGVILIGISIGYALNQTDATTVGTIGGLGLADIIATLFVNSQTRIRKMHSDFLQASIIYTTWLQQSQAAWLRLVKNQFSVDELKEFQSAVGRFSTTAVKNLETYTEGTKEEDSKKQGELGGTTGATGTPQQPSKPADPEKPQSPVGGGIGN